MKQKILLSILMGGVILSSKAQNVENDTIIKVEQLEEVVITATQKFGEKESIDVAKMPLKNIENPQIYSIIPKEIIKNQMLMNSWEIINNSVGVVATNDATDVVSAWVRGFDTRNAIRNGMSTQNNVESDPINIERMEVVKGPSGTLYGANVVSFGGLINKVTKVPHEYNRTELGIYAGSYDLMRITADVNTPLNKEKTALFRINSAYSYRHSFQDIGYYKNITVVPTFLYKVNDRFEILTETEFASTGNTQIPLSDLSGGYFKNFKEIPLPYDKYIGGRDVDSKNSIANIFVKATYKMSDNWTSTTHLNFSSGFISAGYFPYSTWTSDHTIKREIGLYSAQKQSIIQFQQNFNGEFNIGKIRNRFLVGMDYSEDNRGVNTQWEDYDEVDVRKYFLPIIKGKADAILSAGNAEHYTSNENNASVYVSDVINFTDNLNVLLGGRFDYYKSEPTVRGEEKNDDGYEQTFFSPKVGVVYQLFKDRVSLFANYMNGFKNEEPVTQPDGTLFVSKPKKAYQKEIGVKTQLIDKKLFTTLSFYQIDINDATWTDEHNFTRQSGKQVSKGFELELIAQLNNFSIIGGVAYNENKFTEGEKELIGKRVQGAPKNIYNLWADYKFSKGFLNHIRIGAGVNHVSSAFFDSANIIILPEYTVVNSSIAYEQPKWSFRLKFNNLTNQKYWNSDGLPQTPRNIAGSLLFRF